MADKKISALTALTAANVAPATDVVPIVDTSATETKKITAKDLVDGALNGGIANGVLYLNGSKVATSGSALTFDGTSLGVGAAWTSNSIVSTKPAYFQYSASANQLAIAGEAGTSIRLLRCSNDATNPLIFIGKARGTYASPLAVQTGDTLGNIRYDGFGGTTNRALAAISASVETFTSDSDISSFLAFATSSSGGANASEKMRLTAAGNLGIGTSSPGEKLEVNGAIKTAAPAGGTAASWKLGAVASVSPTSPNRTIEVDIGGTIYYLHAKTTND